MIEGLLYVLLEVEDLTRSLAFYRDGLRFAPEDLGEQQSGGRESDGARLRAGSLRLQLTEVRSSRPGRKRGLVITVAVAGVDAYHDALVARGLTPGRPRDEGAARWFTVADPDGFTWRFAQSLT